MKVTLINPRLEMKERIKNIVKKIVVGYNFLNPSLKAYGLPYDVMIEPTNRCNLKCKMCPRFRLKNSEIGDLKFKHFKKIIDEINFFAGNLTIQGFGEPFLNKDIFKMIGYAKQHGIKTEIPTNFTLITEDVAKKIISSGLDWISASIDAGDPENYKMIRGYDLERVLDGIRTLVRVRKEMNSNKPFIRIGCTVFSDNIDEFKNLVRVASETSVDSLSFKTATLYNTLGEELLIEDYEKTKENALRGLELSKLLDVKTDIPEFLDDLDEIKDKGGKYHLNIPCYVPWYQTFISWSGVVMPCCDFEINSGVEFGNAFNGTFTSIWNNEKYQSFRKSILDGKVPHPICLQCNHYKNNLIFHNMVLKFRRFIPLLKLFKIRRELRK